MLINSILLPLILTILIEIAAAYILGYKEKIILITTVLINLVTNPLLNYILLVMSHLALQNLYFVIIPILEIIIVLIEWRLMVLALNKDSKSLLLLSVSMNITSFLTGILISAFLL